MDRILKISAALLVLIVVGCVAVFAGGFFNSAIPVESSPAALTSDSNVTVFFFYGEECSHCHKVIPFLNNLSAKYPEVEFRLLETWHNSKNQAVFASMNKAVNISGAGVPEVIVGKTVLIGDQDIPQKLEAVILEELKKKA